MQGTILSARVEPDPAYRHLQTLLLTVSVENVLKGSAAKQITFRQFLWDVRDVASNAGYRTGDQVLFFLNKPTSLGLISPVGLEQGRFRITRDSHARLVALNGNNNSSLATGLLTSATFNPARLSPSSRTALQNFRGGAIPLDTLKESIHQIVQQNAGAR